jgi:hypothetical protein
MVSGNDLKGAAFEYPVMKEAPNRGGLTEETPAAFAEANELHLFEEDDVAVNRAIALQIETFEPIESFNPTKPHKTQLKWSDPSGADQRSFQSRYLRRGR